MLNFRGVWVLEDIGGKTVWQFPVFLWWQVHHLELRHQQVQLFTALSGYQLGQVKNWKLFGCLWQDMEETLAELRSVRQDVTSLSELLASKNGFFWASKILWWLAHTRHEASEQYQTLHHQEACHLGLLSALCEHSTMKYLMRQDVPSHVHLIWWLKRCCFCADDSDSMISRNLGI